MTSLQQLEYLPGARDHRGGQSREPAHVNPIGAVGATRLEPVQEHDCLADLAHGHVEVADVLELLGELCQLVIVRRKDRLAPDAVVQALRDRPGDRHAVVGRCATPDLIEQHQLRSVAACRIALVSLISTMNVDWPRTRLSEAPTRVNRRSTTPMIARRQGTKDPICASTTQSPT